MFLMKHPVTAFAAVLMIVFILLQIIAGHFAIPSAAQEPQQDPNGPPKVIPAVAEWSGGKGRFEAKEGMRICLGSGGSILNSSDADMILEFFHDLMGYPTEFSKDPPGAGDIYLLSYDDKSLPAGGYVLESSSIIKLSARDSLGFFYGMITFLQSVATEGSFPNGTAVDYPQYEIRSGMLDVARMYIPLEYVERITKYFALFKMNEIHIHINDNGTGFSAFRLESDVEGLTSKDGFYTKADYRSFQERAKKYHINVVTEISTPAHSGCFAAVVPDLMLDTTHLDVTKPETAVFVKSLLDEYISGPHPVFASGIVHIGADEYPEGYENEMVAYLDELIRHCISRHFTPRFWGTFGGDGYSGQLKNVTAKSDVQANYFAVSNSDGQSMIDMHLNIINSCAPVLNCVPGGNFGFSDYADIESLYEGWFVNYLGTGPSSAIDPANRQLKGASFSLWNDLSYLRGYSARDVFDRLRFLVALVSEKTWTGNKTADQSAGDFMERFESVSLLPGPALPAGLPNTEIDDETIRSYPWIGYPYLMEADVEWNGRPGESKILSGDYGCLSVNGSGALSFKKFYGLSDAYSENASAGEKQFDGFGMLYDYRLEPGRKTHLSIYGTSDQTVLVVDGVYAFVPESVSPNGYKQSASFCIPLQEIGSDGVSVSDLKILPYPDGFEDQRADGNLALKKHVNVRNSPADNHVPESKNAVDGSTETDTVFCNDQDEQWLMLDIGSVHSINQIVIRFSSHVPSYEVSLSEDGDSFTVIYQTAEGQSGGKKDDVLLVPLQKTRYIKFTQNARIYDEENDSYRSGAISEIEIYGLDSERYEKAIEEAGRYPDDATLLKASEEMHAALQKNRIYLFEVETLYDRIEERVSELDELERIRLEEESRRAEESAREESAKAAEESIRSEEESKKSHVIQWILFAVCLIAVATALVLLIAKNRKNKS